jgi:lysophospholipase L1-like esterase
MKIFTSVFLLILMNVFVFGQKHIITVYLAGDSTMAQKTSDKRPETGWGEFLQSRFDDSRVKIENHAQNGRSTKSFIAEGRWQAIVDRLKKGDYVFIEFGHNDEKLDKPGVGAVAKGEYRENLIRFVKDVRAKNAFPVLLTPVMRRRFNEKGEFFDTHGEYPDAVRRVAAELKVPLIDMHRESEAVIKKFGAEDSKKLFLILKEGEHPNYPKGIEDNTHFSSLGAEQMAKIAAAEIQKQKIKLRKYLKK